MHVIAMTATPNHLQHLSRALILKHLEDLDSELEKTATKGEVVLFGGAVMVLVFNARPATKDVDAIFHPKDVMRQAILKVAAKNHLPDDWMNDAVAGFISEKGQKRVLFELPHLSIHVPTPEYLLAMKALAARVDATDQDDVKFLLKTLKINSAHEVFALIEEYYPRKIIKPATQFFIEEIMDAANN
ncbi:MAG: DUF6036 family nucleotidyltransferase [Magnetococcus sp. YQC-5]